MDADDPVLVAYREAIKAMQALPNNNPLGLAYQGRSSGPRSPAAYFLG